MSQDASIIPVPSTLFTLLLRSEASLQWPLGLPLISCSCVPSLTSFPSPTPHQHRAPLLSLLAWHTPYLGALHRSALCPDTHGQLSHFPPVLARIAPSQGADSDLSVDTTRRPQPPCSPCPLSPDMLFSLNIACTSSKMLDSLPILVGFILFLLECVRGRTFVWFLGEQ